MRRRCSEAFLTLGRALPYSYLVDLAYGAPSTLLSVPHWALRRFWLIRAAAASRVSWLHSGIRLTGYAALFTDKR